MEELLKLPVIVMWKIKKERREYILICKYIDIKTYKQNKVRIIYMTYINFKLEIRQKNLTIASFNEITYTDS